MENEKRIAILIDSDNISPKYLRGILDEMSTYGRITYRRIYGDWSAQNLTSWKKPLLNTGFLQIQQSRYTGTKNSTDAAMIIDAMDILYAGSVDVFCLVTSDSDFSRLAIRLREAGNEVVGMGERKATSSFVASCTIFKYLDVLSNEEEEAESIDANNAIGKAENGDDSVYEIANKREIVLAIRDFVETAVSNNTADEKGVNIATLGSYLQKRFPEFDVRNYGFSKLSTFLESLPDVKIVSEGLKVFLSFDDDVKLRDTKYILKAIRDILEENAGTMKLNELNKRLLQKFPNFEVQNLGYSKLGTFLNAQKGFEVRWYTVKVKKD